MKCEKCGHDNALDAVFCEECGSKLMGGSSFGRSTPAKPKKEESKTSNTILIVAIIALVVILGIMGGILLKIPGTSNNTATNTTTSAPVTEPISLTTGFPVSQVPAFAQEITRQGVGFTTITYNGVTLNKNQCLYILSRGLVMISTGQTGNIPINQYRDPDNPYGTVTSATITKSDYLNMAQRTYTWMDNNGQSPNYIGIRGSGDPDLSPDTLLNLYARVLAQYQSTGQLPDTITMP